MSDTPARPAFYALRRGGWRDYATLLHLPYTLWHLSYVVIGATLAPAPDGDRLAWTLAAFALALGVGAHALDELNGRPLGTDIPGPVLVALAAGSVAAAVAIGAVAALAWTAWLAPLVAVGAFVVVAYNLELFGGLLHTDLAFALSWGALPLLTAYLATAETLRAEAVVAAAAATLLSLAQRRLSSEVRLLRRRVRQVEGRLVADEGDVVLSRDRLLAPSEAALRLLAAAVVALAVSLALARFA